MTDLPGKRTLRAALRRAARSPFQAALLLLDLDGFRAVNDAHGPEQGDRVLRVAADQLRSLAPSRSVLARLAGDEFALFAPSLTPEAACALAGRIVRALAAPGEPRAELGVSVGVALSEDGGFGSPSLLRAADSALRCAKEAGGRTWRLFDPDSESAVLTQAALRAELRAAITAGDIRPYFQPIVELGSSAVVGLEILARWEHRSRGCLPPDSFIPLVEELRLTTDLTLSLLRQAGEAARTWPDRLRLSLNISPLQLLEPDLPARLAGVLGAAGVPPARLEIEVTESALVRDLGRAGDTLASLRRLGCSVALDDFGTGYSSLYHLRALSFDKIKIDKSFLQPLGHDAKALRYASALVNLGRLLQLETTVEGVEDARMLALFAGLGCTYGQGYLFGRPVPAAAVPGLLRAWEARQAADHIAPATSCMPSQISLSAT